MAKPSELYLDEEDLLDVQPLRQEHHTHPQVNPPKTHWNESEYRDMVRLADQPRALRVLERRENESIREGLVGLKLWKESHQRETLPDIMSDGVSHTDAPVALEPITVVTRSPWKRFLEERLVSSCLCQKRRAVRLFLRMFGLKSKQASP